MCACFKLPNGEWLKCVYHSEKEQRTKQALDFPSVIFGLCAGSIIGFLVCELLHQLSIILSWGKGG